MKAVSVLLAESASVNEGLLFVLGGGVNSLVRPRYPASLRAVVAVTFEFRNVDIRRDHDVRVEFHRVGRRDRIGQMTGKIGVQAPGDEPLPRGRRLVGSFVIDTSRRQVPAPGRYEVRVFLNEQIVAAMQLEAHLAPNMPIRNLNQLVEIAPPET